ncbi:uncharacterized protein ColSpa_05778 [Colletotrichum spaethianum]|uniref:Uncharacterized protein n=1 Tax=Colletotrichum spaethianum TaxID=700344 RepID=A0AA37LK03_9PEZI|nr:uncharacterized protein ColSpa_05778 [Colletotrichum spaethianum]GKT45597.1 hypothetical protein ColSpa_05778 [Colletotrichum spaethianum]
MTKVGYDKKVTSLALELTPDFGNFVYPDQREEKTRNAPCTTLYTPGATPDPWRATTPAR